MEKTDADSWLREWNGQLREQDEIYRLATSSLGLSPAAFWILYTIRTGGEDGMAMSQGDIIRAMCMPKQTTNSALKKLEAEGYIELYAENDRRRRGARLTDEGVKLCLGSADRMIEAEQNVFAQMGPEKRSRLLTLTKQFNNLLKENTAGFNKGEQVK